MGAVGSPFCGAEPPCVSPQVSLPSAWRTAREGSGSRSTTSAPTVSPRACSPTLTSTAWAGTDVGLAARVSPAAPLEGHSAGQGCSSVEEGIRPQSQPAILCLPMSLGAASRDRETPQPAPDPCSQPHAFLTKHKKGFIKTKRSLRACPPVSSTWVCIATGATRMFLPAPARGAQAGEGPGGAGGGRDGSSGPAGVAPLWSRGVSTEGAGAVPSLAALGFLAGR